MRCLRVLIRIRLEDKQEQAKQGANEVVPTAEGQVFYFDPYCTLEKQVY